MSDTQAAADLRAIADEVFGVLGHGTQVAPFSTRVQGFDLAAAYRVAAEVHAKRIDRGERPLGRKIGFTNRTIWAEYGVWAPIWGYMYDSTVGDLPTGEGEIDLRGLAEPRIEPEIVFGIARAPSPGMDDAQLLGCLDWAAHGFEIVQSIYPDWRFAAPDTVAAFGLHGALRIGPRQPIGAAAAQWRQALASFEIDLRCNGERIDHGRAVNVLDGPLFALRHLVEVLAADPAQPPLAAGEIVTTGTLTRAFPVAAGQTWATVLHGIDLPGLRLRMA
jgi:2-oxo-3-hexenedioate decarboxylase